MIIGFTGTRVGMTEQQRLRVTHLVKKLIERDTFAGHVGLHGDCIGADAEFDAICRELDVPTWCRPCTLVAQRAHTPAIEIAPPAPPLERNRAIVDEATCMIACPSTAEEQLRSGTWATIRHARGVDKPLFLVNPDGTVPGDVTPEGVREGSR